MTKIAIKVENLSKAYNLGQIGTGTLSQDIQRWWIKMRGKEDPLFKIGHINDRTVKGKDGDLVWSLKDINFEIEQGQAMGIIGKNGAGKSTLLKILSQITSPTTGKIKINGRIASLLEVGTGFHPELTGRENIFLNGAILGMRKSEIKRKFDEIVAFAGVEKYVDTPVKRYSSGMYVRLAFAVAAHLESDVLIVDEVLAVGDAEFQKKCIGKMNEVSKTEGKAILFVSHNMESIKQLCESAIYLENGALKEVGSVNDVINNYYSQFVSQNKNSTFRRDNSCTKDCYLEEAIITQNNIHTTFIDNKSPIELRFKIKNNIKLNICFEIILRDSNMNPIAFISEGSVYGIQHLIEVGKYSGNIILSLPFLAEGNYYMDFIIAEKNIRYVDNVECFMSFQINSPIINETSWVFKQSRAQGSILMDSINVSINKI